MDATQRTEALFNTAKKLGLVGLSGDGAPTFKMVLETIMDSENDTAPEADELAIYVKRLARRLRKYEPDTKLVSDAVEFLKCTGHSKPLGR